MTQFPHIEFIQKIQGKPRYRPFPTTESITEENKLHRQSHSEKLKRWTDDNKSEWINCFKERESLGLAEINEEIIPIFLKINPHKISSDFELEKKLGIELISEKNDGYIIGASLDNFVTLEEKIQGFTVEERKTGIVAELWEIINGNREEWKPIHILSEKLFSNWQDIDDNENYKLEVSVAFNKPIGKEPNPEKRGGVKRLEKYRTKLLERDILLDERQEHFEEFIQHYGEITSSIVDLNDSFGCEVEISGKGFKDLVLNYQFVFEVNEIEDISVVSGQNIDAADNTIEIIPPDDDAIEVGVIDSGIMEGNRYISDAIKNENSCSYVNGETSTADYVENGGHGTKVAGAILYPNGISNIDSPYQLPCFIRNIRVLNNDNRLSNTYPPDLIEKIIKDNNCEIFNLSINSKAPSKTKHMSIWASIIDKLSFEKNKLFIISVGNILIPDINFYLRGGIEYPDYLENNNCRIANPAQSSFSLAVGSVNHSDFSDDYWENLGNENDVSAFSRIGTGIWGEIKPDVVEYGGGLVKSKSTYITVTENETTSIELIRSTINGGNAVSKDTVGTSFAAPKVTHIAAVLRKMYPIENINLIRALIIQGARLPDPFLRNPTEKSIKHFGYGIPSLQRVTENTEHRITYYHTGTLKAEDANIYSLKIPEAIRGQADEYEILMEVTLAFSANIRRTRQKTKSYLATWLDWEVSKKNESLDEFKDFILKELEGEKTDYDKDARKELGSFRWKIKSPQDIEINRTNSSIQKDWTIVKSYELPEEINIAVRGHKSWDRQQHEVPYALVVSFEILGANIPIYHSIRVENEVEIEV